MNNELKQVIVMRTDLNMRKGKMCAQAAHASMTSVFGHVSTDMRIGDVSEMCNQIARDRFFLEWLEQGMTKIVVGVDSEQKLRDIVEMGAACGIKCHYVRDAGRTELPPGTVTCAALGPAPTDAFEGVTGELGPHGRLKLL